MARPKVKENTVTFSMRWRPDEMEELRRRARQAGYRTVARYLRAIHFPERYER